MHTIYGIRSVIESIQAGKTIEKVLIKKGTKGELVTELLQLLKEQRIQYQHTHPDRFIKFKSKNHQGVIAYVSPIVYQDIDEVVQRAFENGEDPLILLCDGITDVRNFGAIARSADSFGVHALVVPLKGGAAINADAIKTSAGALNSIPVCKTENLLHAIRYLKNMGLRIISATEKTNQVLYDSDLSGPLALVMGDEGEGVSEKVLNASDGLVRIPMSGTVDSLNVSVSAGISLYEIFKQRRQNPST